jgi:malate-CoA ligase subunit alpha
MSGRIGKFHAEDMIKHGTNVVGGVTPGRGGKPCWAARFSTPCAKRCEAVGAEASLVFVPPPGAADAIMEAAEAGLKFAVCVTDGIPSQDMMRVKRFLRRFPAARKMRFIGPKLRGHHQPRQRVHGHHAARISTCRGVWALWGGRARWAMRLPAR